MNSMWELGVLRFVCHTRAVVLNLYKHAEPLLSFPSFCGTPFLPNITESKNGLLQFFFKENVRYPVWICRDPISLILGSRLL